MTTNADVLADAARALQHLPTPTTGQWEQIRPILCAWLDRESMIVQVETAKLVADYGVDPGRADDYAADTTSTILARNLAERVLGR